MKNPQGVSPSKVNQGTARGKEKIRHSIHMYPYKFQRLGTLTLPNW